MRIYPLLCCLGLLILFTSCGKGVEIENFDKNAWKNDPLACKNTRKAQIEALDKGKDLLKSLTPKQLINTLGRPDRQELYERNQRYYLYFYEKGAQCDGELDINLEKTPLIRIRFSAIDIVTEVIIQ